MSIAMALATVVHHSYGPTANDALRGQRTVTRAGEGEVREEHQALRGQTRLPPGTRPTPLVEVQPQGAMVQHSGIFDLVQALDVPVLQMVEQPVDVHSFFRISIPAVAEQVIEVPKLALPSRAVQRAALSEPQLVEQLVEVPTVLSYSLLQQRTAEQFVDTPVPHGRGGGARGGLQGLRDRAQQRFLVQIESTLLFLTIVEEVLGEVFKASPKDRAQQRFVEENMLLLLFTVVEEVLGEVFKASPRDRAHQRFVEQKTSTFPFLMVVLKREVFTVFPEDRVPQRLPLSRPSVLIVEVFKVFLVDRVPQRLPLSRLFLRILIDRCHEPRFMAVMTSGCARLMRRTTASTTGTGGTTLRAGGCREELSTAGACSPLASAEMSCWQVDFRDLPPL